MELKMREVVERNERHKYDICKEHIVEFDIPRVATFEKVSFEEFKKDMLGYVGTIGEDIIKTMYDNIAIPTRINSYTPGYKFYAPFSFVPRQGESISIPTGIRCIIEPGWILQMIPPNVNKHGIELYNTINIYDSSDAEHIILKLVQRNDTNIIIDKGQIFCQGIFLPYGLATNDQN